MEISCDIATERADFPLSKHGSSADGLGGERGDERDEGGMWAKDQRWVIRYLDKCSGLHLFVPQGSSSDGFKALERLSITNSQGIASKHL